MSAHVFDTVRKLVNEKKVHMSSFDWSRVKAVEREAGKLSNEQIIDRLKSVENFTLDLMIMIGNRSADN